MPHSAETIFRDFTTDGIPASGKHEPRKVEIREWGTNLEAYLAAGTASASVLFTALSNLNGNLNYPATTMAWVIGDPVASNNGVYQKLGAAGAGNWVKRSDLPFSFIRASNAGAGTSTAIQTTTSIPVPAADAGALIAASIVAENDATPVTISFNGAAPLVVKTNSGNDVAAGGLTEGMLVLGVKMGNTFRLLSDQASAGIVAAAEAAANRSEEGADRAALAAGSVASAPQWSFLNQEAVDLFHPEVTPAFIWVDGYYYLRVASEPDHVDKIVMTLDDDTVVWFERQKRGVSSEPMVFNVTDWGASPDLEDNTEIYTAIIDAAPAGSTIVWPLMDGVWRGHFISNQKAFHLVGNGNRVENVAGVNQPILAFIGLHEQVATLTANATYGHRTISMSSTAALSAGDIIMLEDDKTRPSDSVRVNQEILKVRSVDSGTVVTVEDLVRSMQDSGTRRVYRIDPIRGASMKGFKGRIVDPWNGGSGHISRCFTFTDCENVEYDDVSMNNSYGRAIDMTRVYSGSFADVRPIDPSQVEASGSGYGVGVSIGRKIEISKVRARGCRHAVDLSACYDVLWADIVAEDAFGTGIALCHNLYGGFIRGWGLTVEGQESAHAAAVLGQNIANRNLYQLRDVSIEKIQLNSKSTGGLAAISVDCSVDNFFMRGLTGGFAATGTGFGNRLVQILGQIFGIAKISEASMSNAGTGIYVTMPSNGLSTGVGLLRLEDIHMNSAIYVTYLNNVKHVERHNVTCSTEPTGSFSVVQGTLPANVTNVTSGVVAVIG